MCKESCESELLLKDEDEEHSMNKIITNKINVINVEILLKVFQSIILNSVNAEQLR